MYGTSRAEFPRRIVCLTAETAEIAFLLGAGDRIVGVPGTARRPEAALERARVGGFTTFKLEKILALEPDLVLAFSDLQRDVVRDLIGAGMAVLCTNQRSFDDVLNAMLLIGGALGCETRARELIGDMQDELRQVREYSASWPDRPRVYFEVDPTFYTAGPNSFIDDLIKRAGGANIAADAPSPFPPPRPSSSAILRSSSLRGVASQSIPSRSSADRAGPRSRR